MKKNMKNKKKHIIIMLLMFALSAHSQKVKEGYQKFKYEKLPFIPLSQNQKTYRVTYSNESTDGTMLDPKKLYYKEYFLPDLKNLTQVNVSGGNLAGYSKIESSNPNIESDLEINIVYYNIEMIDKQLNQSMPGSAPTGTEPNYLNYKLTFKFPYRIKVKDIKTNTSLIDTLIDQQQSTLFPSEYRYDNLGNSIPFPGHLNKADLDLDYNQNGKNLYFYSKSVLMSKYLNQTKSILKNNFCYDWETFAWLHSRVKSKNVLFDICDTSSQILDMICDSINFNTKKNNHLNWHTNFIKNKAEKLTSIYQEMITNVAFANEFTSTNDKEYFLFKMRKNLVISLMLQEEYEKAAKLNLELIKLAKEKQKNLGYSDQDVYTIYALIKREEFIYNKFKNKYNFN
jgi:hypothetical protein